MASLSICIFHPRIRNVIRSSKKVSRVSYKTSRTFVEGYNRPGVAYIDVNRWMNSSCSMPRQNCDELFSWVSINDPTVPVINDYGL